MNPNTKNLTVQDLPSANGKLSWPWTPEGSTSASKQADPFEYPRMSIVTPSYQQGEYLEETIRSVLLQGYPNLEYIVIDGGSTDRSVEIIQKYAPWLSYWESEKDRGQSHAINKGFAKATGDIYCWLNSDDGFLPGSLEAVAQSMINRKRTMIVGVSKIRSELDWHEEKIDRRHPTYDEMLYDGRTFPQPSVFWTNDLWELVSCLREELFYAMDYDIWLRMLTKAEEVIFSEYIFSYERSHPEQKMMFKSEVEEEIYYLQKAYVILHAAKLNGIGPLDWFVKSYSRRVSNAIKTGVYTNLYSSKLQKAAFRAVFYENYISWKQLIG